MIYTQALGIVALVGCIQAAATSETIVGRVVALADGDTLTVLDDSKQQHKVLTCLAIFGPRQAQGGTELGARRTRINAEDCADDLRRGARHANLSTLMAPQIAGKLVATLAVV